MTEVQSLRATCNRLEVARADASRTAATAQRYAGQLEHLVTQAGPLVLSLLRSDDADVRARAAAWLVEVANTSPHLDTGVPRG